MLSVASMSSPHGSSASSARTWSALSASTTSSAKCPSPSPTGPPSTTNPSSTSRSMNFACSSQPSCSRRSRDESHERPCARLTRKYISVLHPLEVEAVRRRGRAGLTARTPLKQRHDSFGRHLQHSAHQGAHHVAEKAVRCDLEFERVAATVPLGAEHVPQEDLVLRLGRRERAEVVLAQKQACRLRQAPFVDRPGAPPRAPALERRRLTLAPEAISIAARTCRVSRVEVRGR